MMGLLRPMIVISLLSLLVMVVSESAAYTPIKYRWRGNTIHFHVEGLGEASWRGGFAEAAKRWEDTPVDVDINVAKSSRRHSCRANGRNEAWWAKTNCGDEWGSRTLAVTSRYFRGKNELKEADIMYNSLRDWAIYDGNRKSISDFVRVSVHELGHALGIDHSDRRDAIMSPTISGVFLPDIDDIHALARGNGYGWEEHRKISLKVSGNGLIQVHPKVSGTVGVSRDLADNYTDFSRLDCYHKCSHRIQDGLRLNMVAVAASDSRFLGWDGDERCGSAARCSLPAMHSDITLKAVFSGIAETQLHSDAAAETLVSVVPLMPMVVQVEHHAGSNQIRVEWSEVNGAVGYQILRASTASAPFRLIAMTAKNVIVDTSDEVGTRHFYRVKACNEYGCGKPTRKHPDYQGFATNGSTDSEGRGASVAEY